MPVPVNGGGTEALFCIFAKKNEEWREGLTGVMCLAVRTGAVSHFKTGEIF